MKQKKLAVSVQGVLYLAKKNGMLLTLSIDFEETARPKITEDPNTFVKFKTADMKVITMHSD